LFYWVTENYAIEKYAEIADNTTRLCKAYDCFVPHTDMK